MRIFLPSLILPAFAVAGPVFSEPNVHQQQQEPLKAPHEHTGPPFTIREQNDELCDSGARQWTGSINVAEGRSMFFWYHESRNDPDTDPVILWMSGQVAFKTDGPGATGEFGMFKEIGPCYVNANGNSTSRREISWINRANVLFIDQPIGIGFSALANRSAAATDLHAGASDLHAFLTTFTASVFPELARRPWHFAGESMGGHWTTGYAQYILSRQQEEGNLGDLNLNIETIIAVSAYIDSSRTDVGLYDFFCDEEGGHHSLMNETACAAMAAEVPECERLGALCRDTYDRHVCAVAARECTAGVGKYFWDGVRPGGWDPYDSRHKCTEPPLCSDLNGGPAAVYLNQPWVQERLGFSQWPFELIDFDLNERWTLEKHVFVPTTRELTWLLDNTDVRVLFVNGNNDIIVNTPGQLRLLDEQPWKRQAWFRNQRLHEWYHSSGKLNESFGTKGGKWKGNYRLSIFTVDEAGHMSPADQPTALEAVVGSWISGDWDRSWLSSD